MAKKLLGFDLGGYQLKMAQVKGDQLIRYAVEQMPDNLVKEGHITSFNAMADFIKDSVKKNRLACKECAMSLPADTYFLRRVKLPNMSVQQLKVNIPFEFRDYVTGELSDYVYDYAVLGSDEEGLDIMAAATSKATVNGYRTMLKRAGLKLVKLVPDVLGLQSILLPHPGQHEGAGTAGATGHDYAILDLGHTSTRIYFFSHGAYEITRTMDSGGPAMARAVAEEKGVDIHIAQLYLEHDQDHVWDLPVMVDMYEEIVTEVSRVMNFYSYNNPNNNIENIYYIGGAVNPDKLAAGVKESIGLDVIPLYTLVPGGSSFPQVNLGPQAYGVVIE